MRPQLLCFALTANTLFILGIIRPATAQLVGCNGSQVDCPTKGSTAGGGICSYEGDIGVVSFDSNITSAGPLTWTATQSEAKGSKATGGRYTYNEFWLDSPPSLNFQNVTEFAGCSVTFNNVSNALQLPAGFSDFQNFGCPTVMGERCAQDIVAQVRSEFISILNGYTDNGTLSIPPCWEIQQRLTGAPLPGSCNLPLEKNLFNFGRPFETNTLPLALTNNSDGIGDRYQTQDGCSLTTGGAEYHMVLGSDDSSFYHFENAKPNSDEIKLYKTGTTPVFTFFYNEPWNKASTGPAPFLNEPEVHMNCLRIMPSAQKESSAVRMHTSLGVFTLMGLFLCSVFWGSMVL